MIRRCVRIQIHLRVAVDVDDALGIALRDRSLGSGELDGVAHHPRGALLRAAVDADIPAIVVNGHIAVKIADLAVDLHIGDGGIGETVVTVDAIDEFGLVRIRQGIIVIDRIPHLLLLCRCQSDGARLVTVAGKSFGVVHQKICRLAVGYAVDFVEARVTLSSDIDFVDLRVPFGHVRRNDVINAIIGNPSALLAHQDIVQPQIGVRLVGDGDTGGGIGPKIPRAYEFIGRHIDIAAAGGDIRDFHIVNRTAIACIDVFAVRILLHKPQPHHVVLDSLTLGNIGRHHFGAAILSILSVIGGNQFVQFHKPCAQGVGIVKGALFDAFQHPLIGQVNLSIGAIRIISINLPFRRSISITQPIRYAAVDGQIDGVGSARDQGAGHVNGASFRQGLLRSHSIGGQELLIGAGAALGPVPHAFVLDDLFLAAAGDDIDVPGGAHSAADVHIPPVGGDFILHLGDSGRHNGIVVGPGLQVRVQVGEDSVLIGSGVKPYLRAALDRPRHIHVAGTVHVDIVFRSDECSSGSGRGVHMGFQGLVVVCGEDDVLRGGRLFIGEERAASHVDFIMDVKIELAEGVRDSDSSAALGLHEVRQVVLGGRDVFLQAVRGDLRVCADGDGAVFREIHEAPQAVAGNGAAEMVFQCIGLHVLVALVVRVVIGAGGDSVRRADMDAVGCDFRVVLHRGFRGGVDLILRAGAAHADYAAVALGSRELRLVLLPRDEIDFTRDVPLAAEGAGDLVRGCVVHMGAHIAHEAAAAGVGQGFARVLPIGQGLQAVQFVRDSALPGEAGGQGLVTADDRSRIAHSHAAHGDVIDISLAVHIGLVVQNKVGILAKGAVRHIDLAHSRGFQPNRIRGNRADGDIMPLDVAFDGATI